MNRNKAGFTLVEVLIVVGIVALLAAIAIPNLLRAKNQSNEAYAQASLKSVATALENYAAILHQYPLNTNPLYTATPPYLHADYFTSPQNGYTFVSSLGLYTYVITATPALANTGMRSFTISTGGVLTSN